MDKRIELSLLGSFDSGLGEGAAEIVAHDPDTQRLFVINSETKSIDILDISSPKTPTRVAPIDVSAIDGVEQGGPNSVAVKNGILAIAIEANVETDPGLVAFFDTDGNFQSAVEVGVLPDMLTFTPDGSKILVANEGQPTDTEDPQGSISIIDLSAGVDNATVQTLDFTSFDADQADLEAAGLRIFPGKTLSEDVEPEYIAVSEDGLTAFVALQEANAVAVVDIANGQIVEIQPLGTKDHAQEGNGLDPSDRDGGINIQTVPVKGLYQPDGIASYTVNGTTYYVTANEGDARDEDARVADLTLDPDAFPDAATLQQDENLGRLEVSTIDGDTDNDGDFDELFSYGARSFSIFDENGNLVFDSGDLIAQITAQQTPELFNANDGDPAEFDARSDAKGAEPEAVVVGEVDGRHYAFVGLERAGGGVMVFDISEPANSEFVQYIRTDGDIAPEGLAFIRQEDSPIGVPLLAVANEVSGTTTLYQINFEGETIVGTRCDDFLKGTAGDDDINGRRGDDFIRSLAGNDRIDGGRGDDHIRSGKGDDDVTGGRGDDRIRAGWGDDTVDGGRGDDDIRAGRGDDTVDGGRGDDTVDAGEGDDEVDGGRGDDELRGGQGDDWLEGGRGGDELRGGQGDDWLEGGRGDDELRGGAGLDTAVFSGNRDDYLIAETSVTDLRSGGPDGIDTIKNIELLEFADQTVDLRDSSGSNFTLQILHASDLEGGVDAIGRAPNFAAIMDNLEDTFENTVIISSGDNYLPGPFFSAGGDRDVRDALSDTYLKLFGQDPTVDPDTATFDWDIREGGGRVDVSIMNIIGFDASTVGNHEFDLGSDTFESIIEEDIRDQDSPADGLDEIRWLGAQFPYLSANLDFSGDGDLANLFTPDILPNTDFGVSQAEFDAVFAAAQAGDDAALNDALAAIAGKPKIAPATIIEEGGEQIGVVGATTQLLESLSSPTGTTVIGGPLTVNDMQQLADVLQPAIDQLVAEGVNKIIVASHLQQIALEEELAGLLSGVDVILAGGSDTLLADDEDVTRGLRPGDVPDGDYPIVTQNADGNTTVITSTDGEYSYVGRLVIEFDADGNVIAESIDENVSGVFATTDEQVADLFNDGDDTREEALEKAFAEGSKGAEVQALTEAVTGVVIEKDGNVFGETDVFIEGRREAVRTEETNLGNLTADANLAVAQSVDDTVLVSLKNGGGIRAPIGEVESDGTLLPPQENADAGKENGEVSQLDIENALRFNNGLTLLTLTPEQLLQVLEHAVAETAEGATPGQFAQVGGINFSFDPDLPAGSRVQSAALVDETGAKTPIVENGTVVDSAPGAVRIVTLSFLADGGDAYPFPDFVAADAGFANRIDLDGFDPTSVPDALDGNADFANFGTEQDALAEFLAANHPRALGAPDGPSDFDAAETPPEDDTRIQNLSVRADTVLAGAGPVDATIMEIQGAGHESPLEGREVVTTGIVTAVDTNAFYIQDPDGDGDIATSDGLFIFTGGAPGVALGNLVQVTGTVSEFKRSTAPASELTVTQIAGPSDVTVLSSGNDLPTAVVLGVDRVQPDSVIDDDGFTSFDPEDDAIDFLESLEGMLAEVNNPLVVSGTNRFDEVGLVANRGGESGPGILNEVIAPGDFNPEILLINDSIVPEPVATTGDTFIENPVGVMNYSFGAYKLELTETPTVVPGGRTPETTTLEGSDTELTVATYNAFNLDPSDGDPGGADDRLDALARSIVNNLNSPDIIALQEIQDNTGSTDDGTVAADQTLVELIVAIVQAGGPLYSFAQIDPTNNADGGAPGSNIRNAFLYNPARVSGPADLQRIEDPAFDEGGDGTPAEAAYEGTRKPLVGTFTFLSTGEEVTVIGNHLKSKTQDDVLYGNVQPPVENTLAQRVDQAEVINDFVADILAADPDANVIVLGDLNDFQFSDTLAALANGNGGDPELLNLVDLLDTEDQYSFIFNGNSQVLDHILASPNLTDDSPEIDAVHINLDFGFPGGNPSDHDPLVAKFDLSPETAIVA